MTDAKCVGLFLVLPAPLNPIGAFDAEVFKEKFHSLVTERTYAKYIAVDLSGLDFVYSDAYNAFLQFHQELLKRNGTFAVLVNRESLAKSLRKVGLERFIRIFSNLTEILTYTPVDPPKSSANTPPKSIAEISAFHAAKPLSKKMVTPVTVARPQNTFALLSAEPKILDKNPLVDEESSSKGTFIVVLVLLLVVAVVVLLFVL